MGVIIIKKAKMNEQEIIEGNKLIAEFMELEKCTDKDHADNPCYYMGGQYNTIRFAKYHTSFDWLMPVIEKIDSNGSNVNITIGRSFCHVNFSSLDGDPIYRLRTERNSIIESIWVAVFEFIKWRNTQSIPS